MATQSPEHDSEVAAGDESSDSPSKNSGWPEERLETMRRRNRWLLVAMILFVLFFVISSIISNIVHGPA